MWSSGSSRFSPQSSSSQGASSTSSPGRFSSSVSFGSYLFSSSQSYSLSRGALLVVPHHQVVRVAYSSSCFDLDRDDSTLATNEYSRSTTTSNRTTKYKYYYPAESVFSSLFSHGDDGVSSSANGSNQISTS